MATAKARFEFLDSVPRAELPQAAHTLWLKLYGMLMDPSGLPPETARALGARLQGKESS